MAHSLLLSRRAGVVLHPSSLPGPHGSGDLGPDAYRFVDWLHGAGQTLWQTLPLGPVGAGHSPYMGSSAFAGNPALVALEPLLARGWIAPDSVRSEFDPLRVDFDAVLPWRMTRLREAFASFVQRARARERAALRDWRAAQQIWLDDYALFMALDQEFSPAMWPQWPTALARREADALAQARERHAQEIAFWCFVQWQFDQQWHALKDYANQRQVLLVGDLPIFVAHHSADCWARPDLYQLDAQGEPLAVAGVPPDFFSDTGQRWGNPLYNWDAMHRDGYRWWVERMRRQLTLADIVRIDHFRGFVDYWEIPAAEPTAIQGCWQRGPGAPFFAAVAATLGDLPIIAEDLGIITQEVTDLRQQLGFPGMKILQFAFSGDEHHIFLPENYQANTVVYTGTHDNDTTQGWWATCSEHERSFARRYLQTSDQEVHWALIGAAVNSVACMALYQWQDVLGLDGSHRMNTPGTIGCWTWRFHWDWAPAELQGRLCALCTGSQRTPETQPR